MDLRNIKKNFLRKFFMKKGHFKIKRQIQKEEILKIKLMSQLIYSNLK